MKRYLINNEVYQGEEMPYQTEKCRNNPIFAEIEDVLLREWKQSLVKLDCDESELDKILHSDILIVDSNPIDITLITEVRADTMLLSNPPIPVYKVYFKEVESESKPTCNDDSMQEYINNYIDRLPPKWTTTFDMNIAMKNAMVEAVSYPEKYLNK